MNSPGKLLERVLDIRRQELRRVLLMSAYLLLIIAAYSVAKAVRDSLFVTKIGPSQLPYVYLLIAAAMVLVSMVYSRAVHRIGLHRMIRVTSVFAISNLLLFWFVFKGNSSFWFYVLYVWASLFGAITASQFWLLATHVFNPREARRLFSRVGIGGIIGGIFGGAITNRMAHWLGTESLLLVCAGMVAVTLVILEWGLKSSATQTPELETRGAARPSNSGLMLRQVLQSRQLTMMVLVLSVGVIVEAFIDYEYKLVAQQSIPSKNQLTAFFGSITFYIGIVALVFQLLFTNRILKRFGVGWAIQLLPAGVLIAFVALGIKPALWTAALLQLVDGSFSYSIHRSGTELLYLPIPPDIRNSVKGFIDTFVDRTGRAAGAVFLLVFAAVSVSIPVLSFIAAGFAVIWIVVGVAVKREYLHSFRRALERKTIEAGAAQLSNIDGSTMESLVGMLSSADDREVLYALDLLSHSHPDRWRAYIGPLIQHGSSAIRARTIAILAGWNDASISREEFIRHPDYETARVATASALRLDWNGSRRNRELLSRLLRDSSVAVAREAIITAGAVGYTEEMPFLIECLGNNRLRAEARQSLLKLGDFVLSELIRRLRDPAEPFALRKRIPKTLALSGRQEAADALIHDLHRLDYHLDYAVLKALNRIRMNAPDIAIERSAVVTAIEKEREECDKLNAARVWLESHHAGDERFLLLARALREQAEQRLERILRLVGLIYSPHDIYSVYYNCRIKPALRPAAIEFLDNLLEPQLKPQVVPLLEAAFDVEKPMPANQRLQFASLQAVLATLAAGDDPWLRTLAGELEKRVGDQSDDRTERRVING